MRSKLIEKLCSVSNIAITLDHWDHSKTNKTYITVTAHFMREDILFARVLATQKTNSKTGEATLADFEHIVNRFGITSKIKLIVTDNFPSTKKAFANFDWLGCSAYQLNTVLTHVANSLRYTNGAMVDFHNLVKRSSALVTAVKRTE